MFGPYVFEKFLDLEAPMRCWIRSARTLGEATVLQTHVAELVTFPVPQALPDGVDPRALGRLDELIDRVVIGGEPSRWIPRPVRDVGVAGGQTLGLGLHLS